MVGTDDYEPAKQLLPFLQRADELQKHDPLVAYYCRLYAMEKGLQISAQDRTKETNSLLRSLINRLEKDKSIITRSPDDNLYVEGFALNVFAKADKIDRSGRADINTAKTFYAASIFFEVLRQFGDLQPEVEQKQKYSIWKAADIRKAIAEGRRPNPGPPGSEPDTAGSMMRTDSYGNSGTGMGAAPEPQPTQQPFTDLDSLNMKPLQNVTNEIVTPVTTSSFGFPLNQPSAQSSTNESGADTSEKFSFQQTHEEPHFHQTPIPSFHSSSYPVAHPPGQQMSPTPPTERQPMSAMGKSPSLGYPSVEAPPMAPSQLEPLPTLSRTPVSPAASGYSVRAPLGQGSQGLSSSRLVDVEIDFRPSAQRISDAQKAAKFGVSALAFDDVPSAVSYLKSALDLLTKP